MSVSRCTHSPPIPSLFIFFIANCRLTYTLHITEHGKSFAWTCSAVSPALISMLSLVISVRLSFSTTAHIDASTREIAWAKVKTARQIIMYSVIFPIIYENITFLSYTQNVDKINIHALTAHKALAETHSARFHWGRPASLYCTLSIFFLGALQCDCWPCHSVYFSSYGAFNVAAATLYIL